MNKKGATADNFYVIVAFFGLAVFFMAVALFWNSISSASLDLWTQSSVGEEIRQNADRHVANFDFILVLVYFGLHLGVLAGAYILRTHPVVFVLSILLVAVLAMLAVPISNTWNDIILDDEIAVVAADIPITNHIFNNLPRYEIIWGIVTAIVMFAFARYEGVA
jgi:hypothetical protein